MPGISGGLFGIFNRGVFPDFAFWTKSAEPLIMTILGGMGSFLGAGGGRGGLHSGSTSRSRPLHEYWPLTMGIVLKILLFVHSGGIAGTIATLLRTRALRSAT